jgi:diguanylate cyclase (GGDEF)-like protein
LLSNTTLDGALAIAEQIRENMEKTEIPCADGFMTKVTISIGVNTLIPGQDCSVNTFISVADEALYSAKNLGRNRVAHIGG